MSSHGAGCSVCCSRCHSCADLVSHGASSGAVSEILSSKSLQLMTRRGRRQFAIVDRSPLYHISSCIVPGDQLHWPTVDPTLPAPAFKLGQNATDACSIPTLLLLRIMTVAVLNLHVRIHQTATCGTSCFAHPAYGCTWRVVMPMVNHPGIHIVTFRS